MTEKARPSPKSASTVAAAAKKARPTVAKVPAAPKPPVEAANEAPAAAAAKPKVVRAAKADKPAKEDKPKKIKMVRDSFTMPENDYAQLAELKKKCLQGGVHVKKSELLRAGLQSLSRMPAAALIEAMEQVEKIKTGRPAKS
ncbi:MAG: hypothetical protein PHX38_05055 [Sulfuricella sp.]|nr:hypothetical protein [Sulfuricella sp.]